MQITLALTYLLLDQGSREKDYEEKGRDQGSKEYEKVEGNGNAPRRRDCEKEYGKDQESGEYCRAQGSRDWGKVQWRDWSTDYENAYGDWKAQGSRWYENEKGRETDQGSRRYEKDQRKSQCRNVHKGNEKEHEKNGSKEEKGREKGSRERDHEKHQENDWIRVSGNDGSGAYGKAQRSRGYHEKGQGSKE